MTLIFLIGLPLLALVLYVNTMVLLKKIKNGEDPFNNTVWGAILTFIIAFGLIFLITTSGWK